MADPQIVLGIAAVASTLYGFALAYYVFARTLHVMELERYDQLFYGADQEKWQFKTDPAWKGLSKDDFRRRAWDMRRGNLWSVWDRGTELNLFLLIATGAFVVTLVDTTIDIGSQLVQTSSFSTASFLGIGFILLFMVIAFLACYIAGNHLVAISKSEQRDLEAFGQYPPRAPSFWAIVRRKLRREG